MADGLDQQVFANRDLNLQSVDAIGYDMDYTLIPYDTDAWERAAFDAAVANLAADGWNTEGMHFDPDGFIQGLVADLELGNLVKATRFGYVIQASHGTRQLTYDEVRTAYRGDVVDLADPRFHFHNTLFAQSEANLFAQLVDRLDDPDVPLRADGRSDDPPGGTMTPARLYGVARLAIDRVHRDGALKATVIADPDRFLSLDHGIVRTLLDQRAAGKRLLLITNSDWSYTRPMMAHAFDADVAAAWPGHTWRDLFDVVIVAAAKPAFFTEQRPAYRVADEEAGLLSPHDAPLEVGEVYHGGSAELVERSLGCSRSRLLYVGDHLFGDVHISKKTLRWRTALVLRELEAELAAATANRDEDERLEALMQDKAAVEHDLAVLRQQAANGAADAAGEEQARARLADLDASIGPLAAAASKHGNPTWGPLMRAGKDKSLFARQVERYADVYTSRVANFGGRTAFAYFRSARMSLPHDVWSTD